MMQNRGGCFADINDILLDLDDPARSQLQVLAESTRGRLSAVRQLVQ